MRAVTPLRVMALGDSITAGVTAGGGVVDDGGYRGTLGAFLKTNGFSVEFVGTRSDYSAAIANRAHEGWPGYVLRSFAGDPGPGQLYGDITRRAIRANRPDLILLMAGTNDLLRVERRVPGYTIPNALGSMDLLLGEIFSLEPGVTVIVAPVVASPRVSLETLAQFNDGLRPLVANYAKRGDRIMLAGEMGGAVPRDSAHFPDGIHPCGLGGYADIARVWLQAIEQAIAS